MHKSIGFIGAGNMAQAIIKGILEKNIFSASHVFTSDINKEKLDSFAKHFGISVIQDNKELVKKSDIIVFSIKPQTSAEVLNEIKSISNLSSKIFVTIMAGKKIDFIKTILGKDVAVVRVMPNTPALLGKGMSVLSKDGSIKEKDFLEIKNIFASIGEVLELPEDKMNIVTAISGSGPAYVYFLAECMIATAIKKGLTQAQAVLLVKQTLLGASSMLKHLDYDPKILRENVTSKGGTTEAAIKVFLEKNMALIIEEAITAAKKRSRELSEE